MPTDPTIETAIRRLRELNWKVAAKKIEPNRWVVECSTYGFGFYSYGATALEAWQAAVKQAEQNVERDG